MPETYELYLIRHGLAEERGEAWPDDAKRPLTGAGMSRLTKEARGLSRIGVTFDAILTSPFVRARQTAEVFAGGVEPRPHLTNVDALTPEGSYQALLAELAKHSRRERIALVGHEPSIGELAARLIGSRHPLPFKKGAICCISVDSLPPSGPGSLLWFLTPKILRRLGRG
ncbi:MAG: phosphohistidine phosphatase SixA [Acidobacteria bacterium]|nr:phosphohistidine phosphatase SixA [Acidobacteriota bacterium]